MTKSIKTAILFAFAFESLSAKLVQGTPNSSPALDSTSTAVSPHASDFANSPLMPATAAANECQVEPYNETVADQTFAAFDQKQADIYRYRQQFSVNLGSWFVHEKWITPSLFTCATDPKVSEIDIANGWGSTDSARAVLERHWDTFITEEDFKYLADKGINTVRLPVGYWNLGSQFLNGTIFEPVASVYNNSWVRVKRAIKQAGDHGVGVLVDLHSAPGSQNGEAHSGVSDGVIGFFHDQHNINKTLEMLEFLSKEVAGVNNVVGLQILNEPQYTDTLEDFYNKAIDVVRNASPHAKNLPLYLHDGFNLARLSRYVSQREDFVVQDHHAYYVFGNASSKSATDHVTDIEKQVSASLSEVASRQRGNLIVGEWSCALAPGSLKDEKDIDAAKKAFCEQQLNVYTNSTAGWAFWTYDKADCESDTGWCFKSALGKTLPSTFSSKTESPSQSLTTRAKTALRSLFRQHSNASRRFALIKTRQNDALSSGNNSGLRGYADGFAAAQAFSSANSVLGFREQYIADSLAVAVDEEATTEADKGDYRDGFPRGLEDGERHVNER